MNSKEKLKKALNHEAGPVPIDFGSNAVTGIHVIIVEKLRKHYGLEERPVKVCEPYQMLGMLEDDLIEAIGVDVIGILPPRTIFGFELGHWKEWKAPWGQLLHVPGQFNITKKEMGCYIYPEGDLSVPPSGHMPNTGYFFDAIIRQEPIIEAQLDPKDNLEEFGPFDKDILDYYKTEIQSVQSCDKGIMATFPGTAFGDIALVPGPFMKHPKGIRDIAEWYMSTAMRKDYIHAIFSKQLEYALKNLKKISETSSDNINVVFLCGTDFGTQHGTFCSVESFNELWRPYYTKLNDWIHSNTQWKTFKHSCGSVIKFIEPFIECGFDILNPVQCSAANMDPQTLKDRFGDRIVFWGGGVDTQHTLPFDIPDTVYKQVLERCEIFSKDGGFVFNAIHNIQANTPIDNIVAMIDAVKEFNK
jgi:hypothetical protein